MSDSCFTHFQQPIADIPLPERFTFPFYYEPHPLSLIAAQELQQHIETQSDWEYDFGLIEEKPDVIIGKMFGVLVVQNKNQEIGYLSAFSGKLAGGNHHSKFVPPVFDMLTNGSFLNEGMDELNRMNLQVKALEADKDYKTLLELIQREKEKAQVEIAEQKKEMKRTKLLRNERRKKAKEELDEASFSALVEELSKESIGGKIRLKRLNEHWNEKLETLQSQLDESNIEINQLKEARKTLSASLQKRLFEQYKFLNQSGELKSLNDIFVDSIPMGGSGECAAPKLLQYAFKHQMKPIALAEFWWGQSPKSEIRKHKNFYPACQGKCKPILAHMLEGIPMDKNVLLENTASSKEIEIIYEDDDMLVINKPAELLSVPGIHIKDSVATRMKAKFPEATGPLIVHRLDMSTSGLMLIAKSLETHKLLQAQFMRRTVKKRYVALLDGIIEKDNGLIDLPLRVDLEDRPRQLVCYEHGKSAQTRWKVIERKEGKTRIHFFPITGRTHQLRMHAAHEMGLGTPILGDDLYGKKANGLCLCAQRIRFVKPDGETATFQVKPNF